MPGDSEDSWLATLGVDVGQIRAEVQGVVSDVETTVDKGIDTVVTGATQLYKNVETEVTQTVQKVENAGSAVVSAAKKVAQSFTPGASSGPMQPDCKPVHGKVPGPPEHLLCQTHGHILDVNSGQIIAASLGEYKNRSNSSTLGKIVNPLANAAGDLVQDAKAGFDRASNVAADLRNQVVQDVTAIGNAVAANLPDASSLVGDIGRSGPLKSPSYASGTGGPTGDGNAEKFYKVSEDLNSKGHHWLWSNDTDVLASAKTIRYGQGTGRLSIGNRFVVELAQQGCNQEGQRRRQICRIPAQCRRLRRRRKGYGTFDRQPQCVER
jgi:hypothetical protein